MHGVRGRALAARLHERELAGLQLEAEYADALRLRVVRKVPIQVVAREVVERLSLRRDDRRRGSGARSAAVGGGGDDKARAGRIDGREQQRARLAPLVRAHDAPAEAVQHLLHQVAPVHLEPARIRRRPHVHVAPRLVRGSQAGTVSVCGRHAPSKLVQAVLDGLVVRQRLQLVHK